MKDTLLVYCLQLHIISFNVTDCLPDCLSSRQRSLHFLVPLRNKKRKEAGKGTTVLYIAAVIEDESLKHFLI